MQPLIHNAALSFHAMNHIFNMTAPLLQQASYLVITPAITMHHIFNMTAAAAGTNPSPRPSPRPSPTPSSNPNPNPNSYSLSTTSPTYTLATYLHPRAWASDAASRHT